MLNHIPRVSIGLPVYNGERYLAAAIDSLLAQTFPDFELIISDNASTDRTPEICRQYAARDARIRFHREETNRGAPWNFNRVFQYARGEYFKWHAADDLCAKNLLECSVAILDRDSTAVLCYPRTAVIDEQGNLLPDAPGSWRPMTGWGQSAADSSDWRGLVSCRPSDRLRGILFHTVWCYELFGLVRRQAMGRTGLHRNSSTSGKVFLTEMALQGRFVEVPEVLFFNRRHADQYTMLASAYEQRKFDRPEEQPSSFVLPHQFRCTVEYAVCIARGPISFWQRLRCAGVLLRYVFQVSKWKRVLRNAWRGSGMWDGSLSTAKAEATFEKSSLSAAHSGCNSTAARSAG